MDRIILPAQSAGANAVNTFPHCGWLMLIHTTLRAGQGQLGCTNCNSNGTLHVARRRHTCVLVVRQEPHTVRRGARREAGGWGRTKSGATFLWGIGEVSAGPRPKPVAQSPLRTGLTPNRFRLSPTALQPVCSRLAFRTQPLFSKIPRKFGAFHASRLCCAKATQGPFTNTGPNGGPDPFARVTRCLCTTSPGPSACGEGGV